MGGKKRKIEIERIEGDKTVMFSKRKKGLFGKAEELCRLYPITRIAILVPPFAPKSHVPFYNFGHSSVDKVVNTFLDDPENIGSSESGFWWEDERFDTLEDLDELNEAGDSILMILNKARRRLADLEKSNQTYLSLVHHHHHHHEEESKDILQSKQANVSLVNHHHHQDESNDLVQSNQRDVSLVNHHHEDELNDLVQSNQREVSLVNHHYHQEEEEKVLQISNEETTTDYISELEGAMTMPDYIPKLEGETSGTANCYLESEEDDQIPDGFFSLDQLFSSYFS